MSFADPFEYIKQLQPGMMIHGSGGPTPDEMMFMFLIREDNRYINKLGKYPNINVRMGTFNDMALFFMIRFNNDTDMHMTAG